MKIESTPFRHLLNFREKGKLLFGLSYHLVADGTTRLADELTVERGGVHARIGESTVEDRIALSGNRMTVTRTWKLNGEGEFALPFSVRLEGRYDGLCVPGQAFGPAGKMRQVSDGPQTEMLFREDACAVPSGAVLWGGEGGVGVMTQPAKGEEDMSSLTLYFPGTSPLLNIQTPGSRLRHLKDGETAGWYREADEPGVFRVKGHFGYQRTFHLILNLTPENALEKFLAAAWEILEEDSAPGEPDSWDEAVKNQASCLANVFLVERGDAIGFVDRINVAGLPKSAALYGYGPANSLKSALSFYRLYLDGRDRRLKQVAFDAADFFIGGQFKSGLFCTEYRLGKKSWWPSRHPSPFAHTGRMGETLIPLLELYRRAKADGDQNENWLDYARRAGNFFLSHPLPEGSLGTLWGRDGALLENRGLGGCPMATALYELDFLVKGGGCRERAAEAASYYCGLFQKLYEKKEESLYDEGDLVPLLRLALKANEMEEKDVFLKTAELCGLLIASRIFAYNAPFSPKRILGRESFKSRGGMVEKESSVWIGMGALDAAPDFYRLWKKTRNPMWEKCLEAALAFVLQWSDPEKPSWTRSFALLDRQGLSPHAIRHTHAGPVFLSGGKGSAGSASSRGPSAALHAALELRALDPGRFGFQFDRLEVDDSVRANVGKFIQWLGTYLNV